MANLDYGPTSPNATQGSRSGQHSAASGGRGGGGNVEYGPHNANVSEGGRIEKSLRFSSAQDKPSLDLKNDPNADALRKIRSMKLGQVGGSWNSNAESALRKPVR